MANKVEVIVGTYEEYLLGYKVGYGKDGKQSLIQSFATRSHTASIRCVAVSGKYLASGGADDRIFIYDMLARKEIQILTQHEGTVNALVFTPDATHILSGGDDGKIVAIRANTWQVEAVWKKAHGGAAVTNISCHPSGKLAISLGNDLTLRTWNLIKGRLAYTTNLKSIESLGKVPDCIAWSPCGDYFTLTGACVVQIWGIKTAAMIKTEPCESKPICVCWHTDTKVVIGLENGNLLLLGIQDKGDPVQFTAHKQRVKAISYVNEVLATVSSSGDVALWTFDSNDTKLNRICTLNIGCRPTCVTLIDLDQFDENYILKREENETTVVETTAEVDDKNTRVETGTVVVEYDEDEDMSLAERSSILRNNLESNKTGKKGKLLSAKQTSVVKSAEKGNNSKSKQWVETPATEKDHTESEEHEKISKDLNLDSKMEADDLKVKVSTDIGKDKLQSKAIKPQLSLKLAQTNEVRTKSEFKKLSVELKRPSRSKGGKKINLIMQKTDTNQIDKEDSDITLFADEGDRPKLNQETLKSDSANSDDSSVEKPTKKKKKIDISKTKHAVKTQKGKK